MNVFKGIHTQRKCFCPSIDIYLYWRDLSSAIDENIERLEKAAKLFSDTMSVVMEIENRIRGREEERSAVDAIIELADAVFVNIQDIDTTIGVLEKLAGGGGTLSQPDAGRLERAMSFAMANLSQIGETLVTANEIAGSRFPVVKALLLSLGNQYNDLLTILRLLPTPSSKSPQIDPSMSSDLGLLRRKQKSALAEVQRVKSRLRELRGK